MLAAMPVEIQEKILSYLHGVHLVRAGRVCRLWCSIANSFCRRAVLAEVPDDVLVELRTELPPAPSDQPPPDADAADGADERWPELYRLWVQAQLRGPAVWRVRHTHYFPFKVYTVVADGQRLFAADAKGVLSVLAPNPQPGDGRPRFDVQHKLYLHDCHINQIQPVWQLRLLVVTGQDTYFIQDGSTPHQLMCAENMQGRRHVSVHADRLATIKDIYHLTCITIYRIAVADARWVHLESLYDVKLSDAAQLWSLWRGQLICFLRTGELCVWHEASGEWSQHCDTYNELRYENPVWVVRDSVLCSTILQRQMMGYWHMDRGLTYWLQGRVDRPLVRVQPVEGETIRCLSARRSLVAAGTESGKILLFHSGTREQNVHSTVSLAAPVCTVELGFNAIEEVALGFSDSAVLVFVKSRKSMVEVVEVERPPWR